jgi:tricorn protease
MQKVYFITLAKDTKSPFEPENDVVEVKKDEPKKDEDAKKDEKKEDPKKDESITVKVDFEGIMDRVIELPTDNGGIWGVTATNDGVYYSRFKSGEPKPSTFYFDLKSKKEEAIGNIDGFDITADGKKMLIFENGKYAVIDAPRGKIKVDDYIDVSEMKIWVNPKDEWKQIFDESWRQMRDFFYDPNMHGVNWDDIHKKYAPLVPYVNSRYDLTYIIGEMIGELTTGHAYVNGGDKVDPPRIKTGLLGAKLSRDGSGYYKIDKILPGQNWTKDVRSPLAEIGLGISEGNFIVAVDGVTTKDMNDIYESLVGKAGKQVELTVNTSASESGSCKVIVLPIADESSLYYYDWVQTNIKKVNDATKGEVGYIHIPDMSAEGLNEFVKYFYPQIRKKALIIDDRGNGGGNVSPMIIERLRRELAVMEMGRNTAGSPRPGAMMTGPMVCLINQYSASDGDLFPYQFRAYKLGKLIGLRTWGGVVGIRGSLPFIDGGQLMRPEFAHYSADGSEWIIEGRGVSPDIEVRNDPAKEYAGIDEQLNKAIEVILDELKTNPNELPKPPAFPNKSK